MVSIDNKTDLKEAYYSGTSLSAIYMGEHLIWPTSSYSGDKLTYNVSGQSSLYTISCNSSSTLERAEIVTELLNKGFANSAVTDVVVGDCVTTIGHNAFNNFTSLSSVTIPNTITDIEYQAFDSCPTLTSLAIPSGITSISQYLMASCYNLNDFVIPDGVTSIEQHAFFDCLSYLDIVIPSGVTSIGNSAFGTNCWTTQDRDKYDKMVYLMANRSVTILATTPPTLGNTVFSTNSCGSLEDTYTIYVPAESLNAYKTASRWSAYASRIQAIPTPSFQGKWLATYTGGTTSSANCDFTSAITQNEITLTDLQSVQIGDCVTSIGVEAFSGCTSLTSVTIGSGVTSISSNAFRYCSGLTNVDIPNGVTTIGTNAFRNCTSLTSCTIGSGVTIINSYAFYSGTSLTNVTIPSGVTSIGSYAFNGCSGLTSVTINATTPPSLGYGAFSNTPIASGNGYIYVPSGSVNAYKSASGWSNYVSKIQPIP